MIQQTQQNKIELLKSLATEYYFVIMRMDDDYMEYYFTKKEIVTPPRTFYIISQIIDNTKCIILDNTMSFLIGNVLKNNIENNMGNVEFLMTMQNLDVINIAHCQSEIFAPLWANIDFSPMFVNLKSMNINPTPTPTPQPQPKTKLGREYLIPNFDDLFT